MRLWILFAPIALVPIVAADFYGGQVTCNGVLTFSFGAMVPYDGNDQYRHATQYDTKAFVWGSASMTGPICNTTVTIHGLRWTAADGGSGDCYPTRHAWRSSRLFKNTCKWQDYIVCSSPICEN
ncbi:uncharacterized protein EI90DRAFT_3082467 [Cantharellus anzutake]|uniref:uncharacterized protein n=1 Tax=Cantharellus anzutake TaxID=1750568 RepID=UPI001908C6B3|nr:uncharacterized protein EI90DRAFT_3082467 [Cantharellus anzutake]KAF8319177.1 hypothetical protein EI90DRAFT_3082467 [Cantharellus anzutake]